MRVLVISETYWGNTAEIAEAIAAELSPSNHVQHLAASDVAEPELRGCDLVIVGAPTHVHGLPGPRSRAAAVKQGRLPEERLHAEGVRELLTRMPVVVGVRAAAFDTRMPGPKLLTGAASRAIARGLGRHGYRCVVPPESFTVEGRTPELAVGEPERARAWARGVIQAVSRPESRKWTSSIAPGPLF